MPRRSKAQIQASQEAVAAFQAPPPKLRGEGMDLAWDADGTLIFFTWYRGHRFDGWLGQDVFTRMEEDGALVWDAAGNPVIDASKVKPPTANRGPAWVGEGI